MRETPRRPHSLLRAQRSNPESFRGDSLDCFAALAMTVERHCLPQLTSPSPSFPASAATAPNTSQGGSAAAGP
ncbi:hypothetical protein DCG74_01115 [Bradyrhizobium sp. WBAH42]|nr:hypothetical protein DAA51_09210 [Bradyrhizobium sp. WBAH10]QCJ79915.1 hypothetical protein DAA53_01130 [Bradyrhizobium sp. WBAH23]QCJ87271.1 hypothetical protein DAA57_01125 [Bradyrhizobium yuanmingense]QCJ94645.1 hypothetical protein DAA61_01205 [Bradyrhizobium sp. WBAH33]QCK02011.1 hypothetical protein DAB18_01210 [Bradyrhizobium sp. WBAH41]UUO25997.1 hypothetical protein DCG74_01115 [Bradyrhizobium sp. WBAH42]